MSSLTMKTYDEILKSKDSLSNRKPTSLSSVKTAMSSESLLVELNKRFADVSGKESVLASLLATILKTTSRWKTRTAEGNFVVGSSALVSRLCGMAAVSGCMALSSTRIHSLATSFGIKLGTRVATA